MGRSTTTQEAAAKPVAASSTHPTFEVVGFEKSDHMPIAVDGRQIDLANVTPELTAWLYERRDMVSGLAWTE